MGKLFGVEIVAMQICDDYKSNFPNQNSYTRSVIWGLKFSSFIHLNTYKRESVVREASVQNFICKQRN